MAIFSCFLPKWHCIFGQEYITAILALAFANPLGSAVLLVNLYTAVLEGHAFFTGSIIIMCILSMSPSQMALLFQNVMQYCKCGV